MVLQTVSLYTAPRVDSLKKKYDVNLNKQIKKK